MSWLSAIRDYITGIKTQATQNIALNAIRVDTNPSAGAVLTSDAKGNGTWQAPASGITTARFTITSAQILNAGSADVVLIPAPAANTANLIVYFYATLVFGTIAYEEGGSPNYAGLNYGSGFGLSGGIIGSLDSLITANANEYQFETSDFGPGEGSPAAQPIVFAAQTNYTTGNGSLIFEIGYVNVKTN